LIPESIINSSLLIEIGLDLDSRGVVGILAHDTIMCIGRIDLTAGLVCHAVDTVVSISEIGC